LTHNFGLHVLPVHASIGFCAWRRGCSVRPFLLASVAALALYAPWLPVFRSQLTGADTYSWYAPYWDAASVKRMLLRTFDALGPGGRYFPESWGRMPAGLVVLTAAGLGLVLWGARAWARRPSPAPHWVTLALFLPIATGLVLSWLVVPHYVPGRVDQMLIPAYVLLAGAGLGALRLSRNAALILATIPLAAGIGVSPLNRPPPHEPSVGLDGELAREIAARAQAGDTVLCTSLSRAPLEHLFERMGAGLRLASYPRSTAVHMGGQDDALLLAEAGGLEAEARTALAGALEGAAVGARLHVVLVEAMVNRPLEAHLAELVAGGRLRVEGPAPRFAQAGTLCFLHLRTYIVGP
jgi:hypothetical protein